MATPYWKREKYIRTLFDYEEENNIPENQRLTYHPYADIPEIPEASPRKKAYVDIREVMGIVKGMLMILVVLYVILPLDFVPGPIDDLLLILFTVASQKRQTPVGYEE